MSAQSDQPEKMNNANQSPEKMSGVGQKYTQIYFIFKDKYEDQYHYSSVFQSWGVAKGNHDESSTQEVWNHISQPIKPCLFVGFSFVFQVG